VLRTSVFLFFLLTSPAALAQTLPSDSVAWVLPTVVVEATRATESEASAARSVYVKIREDVALEPGISLQRALRGLPGVQLNERGHFALGERLLIRGMGYRAAFGVRGAQVFLDGIPLTVADGQSMMDIVEPALVGRAEVLRGPSSLYWGNSSGGVLLFTSVDDTATVRLRGMGGAHGLQHLMARGRVEYRGGAADGYVSSIQRNGWREHSEGGFIRFGARSRINLRTATTLSLTWVGAVQDVQAPGSLTQEQFDTDPSMADTRYVAASAGKQSVHNQAGLAFNSHTRVGTLSIVAYGIRRSLDNPLTFATIDLDRTAAGTYAQLHTRHGRWGWTLGWDLRLQHDDRRNLRDGATVLHQKEQVRNASASAIMSLQLSQRLRLAAGMRVDAIRFSMTDHRLSDGDQSGQRNMSAFSPSFGLVYTAGSVVTYANLSTAFETPTTTELVNRPDTDGGFHPDLGPQRTRGLEAGMRGYVPRLKLRADLAIFRMRIDDRLLPRQSEDGRTWYTNEGRNSHGGVDLALAWPVGYPVTVQTALSIGRYVFLNDPGQGKHTPGVPGSQGYVGLRLDLRGFTTEIAAHLASASWADSQNTVRNDGHMALDLYAAYKGLTMGGVAVQPFLSLTNLLNAQYATSLVVNAFGGRYFEPAPGRAVQAGLSLAL